MSSSLSCSEKAGSDGVFGCSARWCTGDVETADSRGTIVSAELVPHHHISSHMIHIRPHCRRQHWRRPESTSRPWWTLAAGCGTLVDSGRRMRCPPRESCEEVRVGSEIRGNARKWLVDGAQVDVKLFDCKVVEFGFRGDVVLEVADIVEHTRYFHKHGGERNKNCKNSNQVRLSNGEAVKGPGYIQIGDRVAVDPCTYSILKRF